jgi:hypothetical protein
MKIRFQADADLNQAIVSGILRREPTVDFQTSNVSNTNLNRDTTMGKPTRFIDYLREFPSEIAPSDCI